MIVFYHAHKLILLMHRSINALENLSQLSRLP
jgi:hypothetical protein